MQRFLTGEAIVNNDPYGAAGVRFRLYFSGMGLAAMLDRFSDSWRDDVFEQGATLIGLLRAAVDPSEAELVTAKQQLAGDPSLAALVEAKQTLAEEGAADNQKLLETITSGKSVTIDYSALGEDEPTIRFTPFGVRRLDDERCIYTLVPIDATFAGGARLAQAGANPTLHDRAANTLTFAVPPQEKPVAKGALTGTTLNFGTATLELPRGEVSREGNATIIKLLPVE